MWYDLEIIPFVCMKEILEIIVVGLGHQSLEDHLPAIKEIASIKLVGVVDVNLELAKKVAHEYSVEYGQSIAELLKRLINLKSL